MLSRFFSVCVSLALVLATIPSSALAGQTLSVRVDAGALPVRVESAPLLPAALPALENPAAQISPAQADLTTPEAPVAESAETLAAEARQIVAAGAEQNAAPQDARWTEFWTQGRPEAAETAIAEPVPAAREKALAPSRPLRRLGAFLGAAALAAPVSAETTGVWTTSLGPTVKPFAQAGAVLSATYLATKIVDTIIRFIAARFRPADPKEAARYDEATGLVRFVASQATWAGGPAAALHYAGVSGTVLGGAIGVIVTTAVSDTITNYAHRMVQAVYEPFAEGDLVRIDDGIYRVKEFLSDSVEMTRYATALKEKPANPPAGTEIIPYTQVGQSAAGAPEMDSSGYQFAQLEDKSAEPKSSYFKYAVLAETSIGLFKPFVPDVSSKPRFSRPKVDASVKTMALALSIPALTLAHVPMLESAILLLAASTVDPLASSVGRFLARRLHVNETMLTSAAQTLVYGLAYASIFSGVALAAPPLAVAGLLALATRSSMQVTTRAAEAFATAFNWPKQIAVMFAQVIPFVIGSSMALHQAGHGWQWVLASFGGTVPATAYFAFKDILVNNVYRATRFRFDSRKHMGDLINFKGDAGVLVDINRNYVTLKTSANAHLLVPYTVIEKNGLEILKRADAAK